MMFDLILAAVLAACAVAVGVLAAGYGGVALCG